MRRRDFIGAISGAAMALPLGAAAQQPGKVWRIGHVATSTPEIGGVFAQALEQRLADLGYVQGRNIVLLHRFAGSQQDKILQEVIMSLVPQIDLLVVWAEAAIAAKKLAVSVPTVFVSIGFPVELGLVQSLAHPGGNMTGVTSEAALETSGKRLQILKEIVPDLKRVAVLHLSVTLHSSKRRGRTRRRANSGSLFSASTLSRSTISNRRSPASKKAGARPSSRPVQPSPLSSASRPPTSRSQPVSLRATRSGRP